MIEKLRCIVPHETELVFEPGQLLFEGTGFALGSVRNIKLVKSTYLVFLDLSNCCHLNWSEKSLIWPRGGEIQHENVEVAFFGPTCFEGDLIGSYRVMTNNGDCPFKIGQKIVFSNISPYAAAWNTGFNGIKPATVFLRDNQSTCEVDVIASAIKSDLLCQ